jgi:sigma-E factor negative regulatory protein RseC
MIRQKATVIATDESTVWVDTERQSTCGQCQVKQGCGTGLLENHVGKRFSRIAIKKQQDVVVGQQVQLGIPEEPLLYGAFMMYIIPLLVMFLFSATAQLLNFSDVMEVMAGIVGLVSGFYWVHIRFKDNKTGLQAEIVKDEK